MPPRRKPPAYPRPGTGEDFPARRPGTKIGEDRRGRQVKQSTRATQARRSSRERPFAATPLPRPQRRGDTVPTEVWRGGKPTGKRRWPFSTGIRGPATLRDPWPL